MKRVFGGSLTASLLLSVGCSTSTGSTLPQNAGNNSSVGSAGNGGFYNNNQGGGYHYSNSGGSTSSSSTKLDIDAGCAADTQKAALTQVNIVVLLDKSGSMGDQKNSSGAYDWQNCDSRWNPVADTLKAFFSDANSGRLYGSLSFLPADGDEYGMCTVNNYSSGSSSIKVKMAPLDATGRQNFIDRLCDCGGDTAPGGKCIVPGGGTPTLPALQGTINYAASVQNANPGSKTVIVFLTDGEPGFGFSYGGTVKHLYDCGDLPPKGCTSGCGGCVDDESQCVTPDEEVAKVTAVIQSAPPKSIYVAGVGDISEETLSAWADASGNDAINLLNMSGTEAATTLRTRLEAIRQSSIACDFTIPQPSSGKSIEPGKTNVVYVSGDGQSKDLFRTRDGTDATCGTAVNSWYFDNPNVPTKITLCPQTCDALQPDPNGKVQVVYGCDIKVQIY